MNVLILGNSQAQSAGIVLKNLLTLRGDKVTFLAKHGADTKALLELYDKNLQSGAKFGLAVVFNWDSKHLSELLQRLSGASEIIWYGCPPATEIVDLKLAKKVFGSKVTDANHWNTSGYAAEREKLNNNLKKLLAGKTGVKYIDYRDLSLNNSVKQNGATGVNFPNLQDGIHITKSIAKDMFIAPNWPVSNTAELKKSELHSLIVPVLIIGGGLITLTGIAYLIHHMKREAS